MALRFPRFSQGLAQDPTTRRIWFGIATAHDFESHDDITEEGLYHNHFSCHFGQSAIIFLWTFENLFHVAWQGIFEPIAHAIWDPHFGQLVVEAFTRGRALGLANIAYFDLYTGALFLLFLSAISLMWVGYIYNPNGSQSFHGSKMLNLVLISFVRTVRSNFHGLDMTFSSCRYSLIQREIHQMEVLDVLPSRQGLGPLLNEQWNLYAQNPDFSAIAFVFLVASHMYKTNFEIGHSIKDHLEAHTPPGGRLGRAHKGLALASLGVITFLVAQHMYSLPPYAFIAQDFTTQVALYSHHQYIAGFIMIGAFAHGAIFKIRDYNQEQNEDNVLLGQLVPGFPYLGLYVHNDVMLAFGTPKKQILIEPIFAQWIQSAHGKTSYGFNLNAINENGNSLFLTIGPGDFLVHHAIAQGLHTTTLISVKGALDARGSPDKKDFGYSFSCDDPGRGGTCDISACDAFKVRATET
ncbi:hypothetical protein AMTRI_Chr13g88250 [Amborella trichopoda]